MSPAKSKPTVSGTFVFLPPVLQIKFRCSKKEDPELEIKQHLVAIVDSGDVGLEAMTMRFALEHFGYRVHYFPLGRPDDFVRILNREKLYADTRTLLICAHGRDGKFEMPKLASDVYLENEPTGPIGAEFVREVAELDRINIVTTGCTLGNSELAQAFLDRGANCLIGPIDYVDGNAAVMFLVRLFFRDKVF